MSALDSPLEVLAFDYLRFGLLTLVNNVWTWVAVITAAVSVWRLKASSLPRSNFPREASRPVERLVAEPASATAVVASATVEAAKPSTAAAPSSPYLFNAEGRTSGKFTLYYDRREEDEEEDRRDDVNGELDCEDGCIGDEKQWFGEGWWEVTMRMRMEDHMGFYRYQDLTVLDGSVVRLWDGCRRRNGVSSCAPLISCGGGEGVFSPVDVAAQNQTAGGLARPCLALPCLD